jgi:hypothetical protein
MPDMNDEKNKNWASQFEEGFPLEKPGVLLPWGKPLEEIARMSGGVWHKSSLYWHSVTYLEGLEFPLAFREDT